MSGECGTTGRDVKCIPNFDRELEGKRPFWRPGRRWEDNIKTDKPIKEMGYEEVDWINVVQDGYQ
jgi:hypothetical protein